MPIYIQEKIHPQAIIDDLLPTRIEQGRLGSSEAYQIQLFADFNGGPPSSRRRSISTTTSRTGPTA